jgi:hypothetical protein
MISSIYELNFESKIFNKMLYEVDSSDIPSYLLQTILSQEWTPSTDQAVHPYSK